MLNSLCTCLRQTSQGSLSKCKPATISSMHFQRSKVEKNTHSKTTQTCQRLARNFVQTRLGSEFCIRPKSNDPHKNDSANDEMPTFFIVTTSDLIGLDSKTAKN